MTVPFEPPDDATPDTTPAPPDNFGLTPEQWEAQGPQETQRVFAPPPPPPYTPNGYNSAVHPEPLPIPAWTPTPTNGLATSGMVLGIVGACLFWVPFVNGILAILAIIFGAIGWSKSRQLNGLGKSKGIAGVVLGIVTLVGWFVFWAAVFGSAGTAASSAIAAAPDTTNTYWNYPSPTGAATTTAAQRDLRASDLKPTLKITSKQCFGTAACDIEANVRLAWVGSYRPADEDTYTVTYAIGGVTNGPQVGTIDIAGTTKFVPMNELLITPVPPHLTVRITDVEKTS